MQHYYAVVEGAPGNWWINFAYGPGAICSAAADIRTLITREALDALETAAMDGGELPRSIEDGAAPPDDLSEYERGAFIAVIPFEPTFVQAAAE